MADRDGLFGRGERPGGRAPASPHEPLLARAFARAAPRGPDVAPAGPLDRPASAQLPDTEHGRPLAASPEAGNARSGSGSFVRPSPVPVVSGRIDLPPTLFADAALRSLRSRACAYARSGVPVHFRGPAGTGKTTLALQVAGDLGRPVSFLTGDLWLTGAELIGRQVGEDTARLHDRFVQRVTRTETRTRAIWADSVLTTALREGHTLVYDEFTRSPPETNNAFLSALEERVITLSSPLCEDRVVPAHPEFRVILTSNPQEYAGVRHASDALLDRMVTFEFDGAAPETEAGIVCARTGLPPEDARRIVELLHALRAEMPGEAAPSLRTGVLIGRLSRALGASAARADDAFVQICLDVLGARGPRHANAETRAVYERSLRDRIVAACRASQQREETAP